MNRHTSLAAALALAVAGTALAADPAAPPPAEAATAPVEKPSAEAVRAFWNFYFNGKGQGLVLGEAKLCLDIVKDGPNKHDCQKEVPAEGVKTPVMIYVWQAYLVPMGDTIEDLTVQLKLGDQIRETKDLKITGGSNLRYRTSIGVRIPKSGKWTINIMRGAETIKSMELTAK